MEGLGYACALVLAAVFVRAGAAKLARPRETAASLTALGVPAAAAVARALPFVELGTAVVLAAAPRAGGLVALLLLFGFSVVLARALRAGITAPCNCFGAARADPVSPLDLTRNATLTTLAVAALAPTHPTLPAPLAAAVVLVWCAIVATALGRLRRRSRA